MEEVLRVTFRKTRSYRHWHGSGNLRIRPDERNVNADVIGRLALMESPGQNR